MSDERITDNLTLAHWIGQASAILEGLAISAPPHVQQAVAELLAATPSCLTNRPTWRRWRAPRITDERDGMPTTYYVIYRWPDGRDEVRYESPLRDTTLMEEVAALEKRLGAECPYRIEFIKPKEQPCPNT